MKKRGVAAEVAQGAQLDVIKKVGIVAMFADDELMDLLVLKGGNAMDVVLQVNSRASVDLDFSMGDDLDYDQVRPKVERALQSTFDLHGYVAFDVKMSPRPGKMSDELAAFWGGYSSYVADADGHLWEIAHNPYTPVSAEGRLELSD